LAGGANGCGDRAPDQSGTNRTISIGELAELAIGLCNQRTGRTAHIVTDAARIRPDTSEVLRLRSNYALARQIIGWEPQVTLEAGLVQTIDFIARTGAF